MVRQADGLPLTFMNFPGSVTDVTQAPEMIKFFSELGEDVAKNITMICDRGYISERNVKDFDDAGIDFLLMLRKDLSCGEELLKQYSSEIKKNEKGTIIGYRGHHIPNEVLESIAPWNLAKKFDSEKK